MNYHNAIILLHANLRREDNPNLFNIFVEFFHPELNFQEELFEYKDEKKTTGNNFIFLSVIPFGKSYHTVETVTNLPLCKGLKKHTIEIFKELNHQGEVNLYISPFTSASSRSSIIGSLTYKKHLKKEDYTSNITPAYHFKFKSEKEAEEFINAHFYLIPPTLKYDFNDVPHIEHDQHFTVDFNNISSFQELLNELHFKTYVQQDVKELINKPFSADRTFKDLECKRLFIEYSLNLPGLNIETQKNLKRGHTKIIEYKNNFGDDLD